MRRSLTAPRRHAAGRTPGARVIAITARPEVAAIAVAAAVAAVWAVWLPPVRDLAGHLFRVEQYEALGPHIWNTRWYGGHHTLGYSALFPPLAASLGLPATGILAAVAAAGCFAALVRRQAGAAAWPGAVWLGAGTATNLFTGRLTFALGVAVGLGACLAAQRGRPGVAAVLGILTGATSAVAAVFVTLAGVAAALTGAAPRARRHGAVLAAAPAVTVLAISAAFFPIEGSAHFGPFMLAGSVVAGAAVWAAAERRDRVLRTGALLYALGCVLAFLVPTALGGTAGRLAALMSGPLLLTLLLVRRRAGTLPAWATRPVGAGAVALGLLVAGAWQWGSVRIDIADATSPAKARSTREAFYAPLIAEIERRSRGAVRVEIPFTAMHYEARWVAAHVSIARGWLRQLDRAHNLVFYEGRLTASRYRRWLRENGIGWIALPDVPLDHSARAEARIIRSRPEYLREVWRSPDWRLFRVEGSPGLVSGPGRLLRLEPNRVLLHADEPGRLLLRVHHSPYLRVTAGDACVERAPGGWTAVRAGQRGDIAIAARIGPLARLGRQPQCPAP